MKLCGFEVGLDRPLFLIAGPCVAESRDLEALKAVGLSATPADGMPQVAAVVDYVCSKKGGEGAVRELVEMILEAQATGREVKGKRGN